MKLFFKFLQPFFQFFYKKFHLRTNSWNIWNILKVYFYFIVKPIIINYWLRWLSFNANLPPYHLYHLFLKAPMKPPLQREYFINLSGKGGKVVNPILIKILMHFLLIMFSLMRFNYKLSC
jgi:hypothetical protein